MGKVVGKYYWVATPYGKEIAYQRNSGHWELCGVSAGENVNGAILQVIAEVANDVSDTLDPCALGNVVEQSEQFCECDGVQDLIAGTGECRKCGGQCTY